MKARSSKHVSFLTALCLAALIWVLPAAAQPQAELDIRLYAGLTITGAVGTVYSIEYVTDLAQTNTPSAWRCLELLQLPPDLQEHQEHALECTSCPQPHFD